MKKISYTFYTGVTCLLMLLTAPSLFAQCTNVTTYATLASCFTAGTTAITITTSINLTGNITLKNNTNYTLFTNGSDIIRGSYTFNGNGNSDISVINNGGATLTIKGNNSGTYTISGLNNSYSMMALLGVLEVDLKEFKIVQNGDQNMLIWSTASEKNSAEFEIQMAQNGGAFSKISSVKANGFGSQYSFIAPQTNATTYYRLKMIDVDGKIGFSPILSSNVVTKKGQVKVYPNPVGTEGYLNIETAGEIQNITVTNTLGQAVLTAQSDKINVTQLAKGLYNVSIKTDLGTSIEKFFKL